MLGYWLEGGNALQPQPDAWLETCDMDAQLQSRPAA